MEKALSGFLGSGEGMNGHKVMTFEEWSKHNKHLFSCSNDVYIAKTTWMEARAYPDDVEEKIYELTAIAADLYFMLGTVCHDYQIDIAEDEKSNVRKALERYRKYRGY